MGQHSDKYRPEPEHIRSNSKNDLKPKLGPKIKLDLKNYARIACIWLK